MKLFKTTIPITNPAISKGEVFGLVLADEGMEANAMLDLFNHALECEGMDLGDLSHSAQSAIAVDFDPETEYVSVDDACERCLVNRRIIFLT